MHSPVSKTIVSLPSSISGLALSSSGKVHSRFLGGNFASTSRPRSPATENPFTFDPQRIPTCMGIAVATISSPSNSNLSSLICVSLAEVFWIAFSLSYTVESLTRPVTYSCIFAQGAPMTFSKIQKSGCFWNKSSTALKNVSPEHPLSSISNRLVECSKEKFLQDVPATNKLNGGISVCRPYTSRGFSSVNFTISGYRTESKLRAR